MEVGAKLYTHTVHVCNWSMDGLKEVQVIGFSEGGNKQ